MRRKNRVLDAYACVLCNMNTEETLLHLFFLCPFSRWVWRLLNISWDLAKPPLDMIIDARQQFGSPIFREIIMVAAWSIWCHRNSIIFFFLKDPVTRHYINKKRRSAILQARVALHRKADCPAMIKAYIRLITRYIYYTLLAGILPFSCLPVLELDPD